MERVISRMRLAPIVFLVLAAVTAADAQQQGPPQGNPRREMLEQRLRERTGEMVRRRLELTDDQMRQLQTVNRQFERERGALVMREREMRRELRGQMMLEKPDQNRVSQLLDQTIQIERQRLDLVQAEQRELAKFLTPVQRAKMLAIQSELRRRAQELRKMPPRRGNAGPGGPPRFE